VWFQEIATALLKILASLKIIATITSSLAALVVAATWMLYLPRADPVQQSRIKSLLFWVLVAVATMTAATWAAEAVLQGAQQVDWSAFYVNVMPLFIAFLGISIVAEVVRFFVFAEYGPDEFLADVKDRLFSLALFLSTPIIIAIFYELLKVLGLIG